MTNDSPALPRLPVRPADSHKGDYGRALLIGGSRGMSGAIALSGVAALRSGAGLVTLAVPDVCLETVACFEPSYMTTPLPCDESGRVSMTAKDKIAQMAENATCIACGPGIGRSAQLTELIGWMYKTFECPAVFDADALFALAQDPDQLAEHSGPRILTPHPGEFGRLIGCENSTRVELEAAAQKLTQTCGLTIALKGHRTLITNGHNLFHNTTGNPGMATGGSGDVLTGIIAALICQGMTPLDAARLGVHVHGLSGDLAAKSMGDVSLIASDLSNHLPNAFQTLDGNDQS